MTAQRTVRVGDVTFANDAPIAVFAGPCQMESRSHALEMAAALKEIAARLGIGLVYKTSFDKANRTSLQGKRGLGLDAALSVFAEVREKLGLPVVTDVHEPAQCAVVGGDSRRTADTRLLMPSDGSFSGGGKDRSGGEN